MQRCDPENIFSDNPLSEAKFEERKLALQQEPSNQNRGKTNEYCLL